MVQFSERADNKGQITINFTITFQRIQKANRVHGDRDENTKKLASRLPQAAIDFINDVIDFHITFLIKLMRLNCNILFNNFTQY
jgi:hypothetical protein